MAFLKFRGKQIFTGMELLDENYVLITNERGIVQEVVVAEDAGSDVPFFNGVICPGFINAHCHLELSHLKNQIEPGNGMVPFLLQVMGNRFQNPEKIQEAIDDAEAGMLQNGIVAVGDICNTADTIAAKKKHKLYYHNFLEVSGFIAATATDRLTAAQKIADQFKAVLSTKGVSVTPHAPYSVSPELFTLINNLTGSHLLTLHNQESEAEQLFFTKKEGGLVHLFETIGVNIDFFKPSCKSSLQTVCPVMNLQNKQWLLVHNCYTTMDDIKACHLLEANVFLCLCPGANLYIGNPLPDIEMLQQSKLPICLGTDSLASNWQLSILQEMKCIQDNFSQVSLPVLLQWATLNGARALQIEDCFGSFTAGKQPGVLVIYDVDNGMLTATTKVRRII